MTLDMVYMYFKKENMMSEMINKKCQSQTGNWTQERPADLLASMFTTTPTIVDYSCITILYIYYK